MFPYSPCLGSLGLLSFLLIVSKGALLHHVALNDTTELLDDIGMATLIDGNVSDEKQEVFAHIL